MKIKYENELIENMVLGDPKTLCLSVHFDKNDSNDTKTLQYFIIRGLVSSIKINSAVSHMFFSWSFNHNTVVPINI